MADGAGRTLREQDAWDAALAWRTQLERRVRLEVDLNECDDDAARVAPSRFEVVDRFEWVTFVFNGFQHEGFRAVSDIEEVVVPARAATIVWYALSCCPGFSGTENPRFWRGVFTELAQPAFGRSSNTTRRAQVPITEAVRFFDDPDKPFPRIRIVPKGRDAERCLRGFLQAGSVRSGAEHNRHDQELERILGTLRPYIRLSHWSRAIPMALDEVPASVVASFLPRLQVRCTPNRAEGPHLPPDFQLESIFLQGKDLASLDVLQQIVVFSHAKMVVRRCDSADVRALVSAPDDTRHKLRRRVHVRTVDLIRPTDSASHFAALCATLPSSEWVSASRVFSFGVANPKDRLYQSNIAWLAYAVFHPDGVNSGSTPMTDLEISSYRFPFVLVRIFRSMSMGNNLAAIVSGDTKSPIATAYFSGRVEAGTVGRAKPNRFSHSVYTFTEFQWVTICTTTANTTMMDSWVAAVVPGVGLVWIRKESIRAVAKRAPAASCLRRLRLSIGEDPHAALFSLLGILGKQLEYLDIADCAFNSIPTESILRLCPHLKSLRITYSPEFWSEEGNTEVTSQLPLLEELELQVSTERPPRLTIKSLRSPVLSDLKTLRVVVGLPNVFSLSRDSFLTTLEKVPSIQYAHWHARNGSMLHQPAGPGEIVSYRIRQQRSRERLGDLSGWSSNILDGPKQTRDRLAFLSVVRLEGLRHETPSPVGGLDPDILRNIFAFTPARDPREVYISDGEEF